MWCKAPLRGVEGGRQLADPSGGDSRGTWPVCSLKSSRVGGAAPGPGNRANSIY